MSKDAIREAGLKLTKPRAMILEVFEQSPEKHHSVEDVHKELLERGHDIGLGTIYRVLTQFEVAGLVKRLNFEGGYAVFELKSNSHHDHMVCLECGRIYEFVDSEIEEIQERIANERGFRLLDHSHLMQGYCWYCREKNQ
ncbi:MAG TPA: ferric iron uptake transcriptional regulator [Chromatiaceae bacterium]|nr:ferric iron uptake transcriptional regulator [Chromatiaceae bacterium]